MAEEEKKRKYVAQNRKARHEYEILETFDAGLVLTGTEIKSVRAGKVSMSDSFARPENGEMWLQNMHIAPYEQGNRFNVESRRTRKLLLHKAEINRITGRINEKGLTVIPLAVFLQRGYAKVQLGIGRGKKIYDKREDIANRDRSREAERELSRRD
ncbi:MAG TPA: SsrA-binding protein SmpB [Armatimonadota bacterium]|jgi:SsrA-binding protein